MHLPCTCADNHLASFPNAGSGFACMGGQGLISITSRAADAQTPLEDEGPCIVNTMYCFPSFWNACHYHASFTGLIEILPFFMFLFLGTFALYFLDTSLTGFKLSIGIFPYQLMKSHYPPYQLLPLPLLQISMELTLAHGARGERRLQASCFKVSLSVLPPQMEYSLMEYKY